MSADTYAFDTHDIQGIIMRAYSDLPAAYYLLLAIRDAAQVKRWLAHLADEIEPWRRPDNASSSEELRTRAVHIAFTRSGLEKLGLKKEHTSFSAEFEEGMTTAHKRRILGDYCEEDEETEPARKIDPNCHNDPDDWDWGGTKPDAAQVDVLVMLYGGPKLERDAQSLTELRRTVRPSPEQEQELTRLSGEAERALDKAKEFHVGHIEKAGVDVIRRLETRTLIKRKEHFGFHDGVSQPVIKGTDLGDDQKNRVEALARDARHARNRTERDRLTRQANAIDSNMLSPGEFILGYPNEYGMIPDSPTIPATLDPKELLPSAEDGRRDFGRNGTYLVFRQLEQDVAGFWQFLEQKTKRDGHSDPPARDKLGAKMVGRWRSGAPLVCSPDHDDERHENENEFDYLDDAYGDQCPLGSHVRRGNPRDAVMPGSEDLLTTSKVHRILRRGRSYGDPVATSMAPEDILKAVPDGAQRGLHFICINTDIGRQFEFVQHTWFNNQKFAGLYDELDPIVGAPHPRHRDDKGAFTIQTTPIRERVTGVERHVHIRGGAYFFLPGLNAIRALANMPDTT